MDPESEILARQEFSERGFSVVGWYHSHPTFEPTPSIRDIENQVNYQASKFRNTLITSAHFLVRHCSAVKEAMNHS
jgi:proteasome lid subunit RPN8/RPN11